MQGPYRDPCRQALNDLLVFFNGNKSQMAATAGVSRNAVSFWFSRGHIGKQTAIAFDADDSIPFTKEQLRPDVKAWSAYKPRKPRKQD